MRDGLHILHIVGQADEFAEAQEAEHFNRAFLCADEFRLHLLETARTGDVHRLADERLRESAPAKFRMHVDAHAPDVPLPAAQILVERADADDGVAVPPEQRQVAPEIKALAPGAHDIGVGDAVLDVEQFRRVERGEETVEGRVVPGFQRAHLTREAVAHGQLFGVFVEGGFE